MADSPQLGSTPKLATQDRATVKKWAMPNPPTQSFNIGDDVGMKDENGKLVYGVVSDVHSKNDEFFYDLEIRGHTKKDVPQKQLRLRQRKANVEKALPTFIGNHRDESYQTNDPEGGTDPAAIPASPTTISSESTVSGGSRSPLGSQNLSKTCGKLISTQSNGDREIHENTRSKAPIVKEIHNTPQGYPRLAAFLDSDENFMVYRHFGYLQSRLLVEKQNDLHLLEIELEELDCSDEAEDPRRLQTRRDYDAEHMRERVQLLKRIERKWLEYSNLLAAAQKLTKFNKPTEGEYVSVRNWIEGQNGVLDEDAEFVYQKEDLITLRPGREYAWLDAGVERFLRSFDCRFIRWLFQSGETRRKTDGSGHEVYFTRNRIEQFVLLIITFIILVLLVVPIYVLYQLSDENEDDANSGRDFQCIGVLLVSTFAFSACISLFTKARRHEILAASAA
ncbi:hypothetical protein LTR84_007274 [Exophiala bonariae]|uniref:DUF6594 domain-containing protein n=1 Tax=Exophiala bonariae TaxID=1690606 RepID=A0AAV9MZ15_9EURO|nr:hypothetical protein LTR84_007274 [Exophiala bonariae]